MVRCVLNAPHPTRLLHLAIKLGVFGSEKKLGEILHGYGTPAMATDYLNSGSAVLRAAAEEWAARHHYEVLWSGGTQRVSWGRF